MLVLVFSFQPHSLLPIFRAKETTYDVISSITFFMDARCQFIFEFHHVHSISSYLQSLCIGYVTPPLSVRPRFYLMILVAYHLTTILRRVVMADITNAISSTVWVSNPSTIQLAKFPAFGTQKKKLFLFRYRFRTTSLGFVFSCL